MRRAALVAGGNLGVVGMVEARAEVGPDDWTTAAPTAVLGRGGVKVLGCCGWQGRES